MNKLIVVSGGTKGIGRAIVEKFMQNGFDAIVCARSEADLAKMRQETLENYPNQSLITFVADLSDKLETEKFIAKVNELKRPLEVLVNNTGLFLPGQIHSEAEGLLETMINTNLYSAYRLSRGFLNEMISRKNGYIFNVCSTASITPYTNGGSYCISKYAMYGMSKVLREELKPHNIRVTSILPGATQTASWADDFVETLPENRLMQADDVATMVYSAYTLPIRACVEEILIRPLLGDL
jgi:NADP-dependent 3-hydroxy acid dehydrogenase YdfG